MGFRKSFEVNFNIRFGIPIKFPSQRKKIIEIGQETMKLCFNLKKPKLSCLKWTYGRPGIDYRVASLFTRYLIAKGLIPEDLNFIGQF